MTTSAGDDPTPFYAELAAVYHLVYADWERSIGVQGAALAKLLRERWPPCQRVLDAACGIGTQALGLAVAGFEVVGSDLSAAALARARHEAAARGLQIEFVEADLRALGAVHRPGFDAVIACDNAVPHLLTREEILAAFRQMHDLLRPGGGCVVSARDYGAVERAGTHFIPYGVRQTPEGRVAIFQLWDFFDGERYDLSMFFVHDGPPAPRVQVFRARYFAITLPELADLFRQAGFVNVERLDGLFFQPLLVGTKPLRA